MSQGAFAGSVAGSGAGSVAGRGTGSVAGSGAGGGTTHININTHSVVASWHFGTHMDAFWHSYGRILALIWTHVSWTLGRIMEEIILKKSKSHRLKFSVTGGLCWEHGW